MSNKIPAEDNKPAQPRPEYPRPILRRDHWLNLNGRWQFQPDPKDQGLKERWFHETQFEDSIVVPFPIESEASEQHNLTPERVNWYHRQFLLPVTWEGNILLHIGACDHWTRVFVNGQEVGQHRGVMYPLNLISVMRSVRVKITSQFASKTLTAGPSREENKRAPQNGQLTMILSLAFGKRSGWSRYPTITLRASKASLR